MADRTIQKRSFGIYARGNDYGIAAPATGASGTAGPQKGRQNNDIAVKAGLDRRQVVLWRPRFLVGGIDALRKDAPCSGRLATFSAQFYFGANPSIPTEKKTGS